MPSSIFDKKFVTTAVIIAIIYTTIIIVINKIVGKEAAGVAGVALTALATAIFKQFEGLKFQNAADTNDTNTSTSTISMKFSWWQVILIAFLFSGMSILLIDIMNGTVPLIFHPTKPGNDIGIMNGKLINHYTIWEQSTKCLSYLICSIIATKAFKRISFSVIIVAALFGIILDFYTETLSYIFFGSNTFSEIGLDLEDYAYSFLWIVFSFIGSYLSQKKKITTKIHPQ